MKKNIGLYIQENLIGILKDLSFQISKLRGVRTLRVIQKQQQNGVCSVMKKNKSARKLGMRNVALLRVLLINLTVLE